MGYPAELGDYRSASGQIISDAFYSRLPAGLRSGYTKVVAAAPVTAAPAPTKVAVMQTPTALIQRLPSAIASKLSPATTPPPALPPTSQPSATQQTAATMIEKAAPIAAPLIGPAAALLPPVAQALKTPATFRVAVDTSTQLPPAAPAPAPTTTDSSSATVYNADGSPAGGPARADVTGGSNPLDALKNLPTVAKIAIALGAFALFGRK